MRKSTLFGTLIEKVLQPEKLRNHVFLSHGKPPQTTSFAVAVPLFVLTKFAWQLSLATSKIEFLREILDHPMFQGCRTDILMAFCQIQRIYYAMARLAQRFRLSRAKIVVDTDMQLNPIRVGDANVIQIFHLKQFYLFNVHELMRQINVLLSHSCGFDPEPLNIRNPYNNLPFPKSVLYSLYLHVMRKGQWGSLRRMESSLFAKFCRCEFDLEFFTQQYEVLLADRAIETQLASFSLTRLENDVRCMISQFNLKHANRKHRICIHKDFPAEELVEIFRPYLKLECRRLYSLVQDTRMQAGDELQKRLQRFHQYNPDFGEMKYRLRYLRNTFRLTTMQCFDKRHVPWYTFDCHHFMTSHLNEVPTMMHHHDSMDDDDDDDDHDDDDEDSDDLPGMAVWG